MNIMVNWLRSRILSTVILLSITLLALGATRVISGRSELHRRERLQAGAWIDWQFSIADDLRHSEQRLWRETAETSPEAMMRACSYRIEPAAVKSE